MKTLKNLIAATSLLCLFSGSALFGQAPTISGVVDAASFGTQLAPGSLANVNGTNFGSSTSIAVNVGAKACAVLSATATQLLIEIAVDAPAGATAIQVGSSAPFNISLQPYAPEMYTADGSGKGDVQAFHADGSPVSLSRPASAQEAISLFAVGLGATFPAVPTGTATPTSPFALVATPVQMTIANEPVAVLFVGLAPGKIGVYQLNFVVPGDLTTGDQPISFAVGGTKSNTLTLPTTDAPVISGLQNNYSYITTGFPNYGIAQG